MVPPGAFGDTVSGGARLQKAVVRSLDVVHPVAPRNFDPLVVACLAFESFDFPDIGLGLYPQIGNETPTHELLVFGYFDAISHCDPPILRSLVAPGPLFPGLLF